MELVQSADRLTQIFGYWPTFHDAEVIRIVLDRGGTGGPTLEAEIHVFEMTSEIAPSGFYVLKKHTFVTLLFRGVALHELKWFNHQNVLFDLSLSSLDPTQHDGYRIDVEMTSSYGMAASFQCVECEVTNVQPWVPCS